MPRRNSGPCEEESPDPEPPVAIGSSDCVLVREPVQVPTVESSRVMNTEDVHILNLKSSDFELRTLSIVMYHCVVNIPC